MNFITIPMIQGFIAGAIFIAIVYYLIGRFINRKKKHNLPEMKALLKETHDDLFNANQKLSRLYSIFNEIEENL